MSYEEIIDQAKREQKGKPYEIYELLEKISSGIEHLSEQVAELRTENERLRNLELTRTMGNAAQMQANIDSQYKYKY